MVGWDTINLEIIIMITFIGDWGVFAGRAIVNFFGDILVMVIVAHSNK